MDSLLDYIARYVNEHQSEYQEWVKKKGEEKPREPAENSAWKKRKRYEVQEIQTEQRKEEIRMGTPGHLQHRGIGSGAQEQCKVRRDPLHLPVPQSSTA